LVEPLLNERNLTDFQNTLLNQPFESRIFLEGPYGAGKTTAAVYRLLAMLEAGVRGDQVLVLVPQRTLAAPYYQALRSPQAPAGGMVQSLTLGGLARRAVELFWPLVSEDVGFARPQSPPTFLTIETAQYYMAYLVRPLIEENGYFEGLVIDRNRLYSQIIDNLNKAAVVGFPHEQIGERLSEAWVGEPGQLRVYQDAQDCANRFRTFCLAHNLLDFSLQVEIFRQSIWPLPEYRGYLSSAYRHLIFDNLEEDTPFAYDLLEAWLPELDSALLVYDWHGGYRTFLGADPGLGYRLKDHCQAHLTFADSLVVSAPVQTLGAALGNALGGPPGMESMPLGEDQSGLPQEYLSQALEYTYQRYYPQMLDWVAERIAALVYEQGLPPGEIAVLSPYLSDALRFALAQRLGEQGIAARSFRPSRSLREEPAARCLVTLSTLAHPGWGRAPERFDVAYALMQAIEGMDLVRAQLLASIVYRPGKDAPALSPFDGIQPVVQERISYSLGERYERLRSWLLAAQEGQAEFDHFLARLFGEVLSQPGYGFHHDYDAGQVSANLIESIQKFRWVSGETLAEAGVPLGQEYLSMLADGVIAAQYLGSWWAGPEQAVLLAPAYTFLMSNRPVSVQFWLDVGGRGWSERLFQPLTHPHVLSRRWPRGRIWNDLDEMQAQQEALYRLVVGLLRRCRERLYLGMTQLGESGYEGRGPLLTALQHVLRAASGEL
jgi:hypothetical protein